MATEKTDVKNVRMNKNNVLVRGRGKKAQEICAVDVVQAAYIKRIDKQKRGFTTAAWLNGVATLCAVTAGSMVLSFDHDFSDQVLASSQYLLALTNVFCLGVHLKKVAKYKKQLNDEYVEAIARHEYYEAIARHEEEMEN